MRAGGDSVCPYQFSFSFKMHHHLINFMTGEYRVNFNDVHKQRRSWVEEDAPRGGALISLVKNDIKSLNYRKMRKELRRE